MFQHFTRLFRRQKAPALTHTRYGIMLDISTTEEQRSICWYVKSPDLAAIVDGELVMYERRDQQWSPVRRADMPSYKEGSREYTAFERVMAEAAARMRISQGPRA